MRDSLKRRCFNYMYSNWLCRVSLGLSCPSMFSFFPLPSFVILGFVSQGTQNSFDVCLKLWLILCYLASYLDFSDLKYQKVMSLSNFLKNIIKWRSSKFFECCEEQRWCGITINYFFFIWTCVIRKKDNNSNFLKFYFI